MPDIKDHYQEMYLRWSQYSEKGYYEKWTIYAYVAWRIIRPCDSGLSCRGELFITVLRLQNTESRDKDLETRSASKGTRVVWGPALNKGNIRNFFFLDHGLLGWHGFIFIRFIRAIRVRFNRRIVNQHYMELLNQPVAGFDEGLVIVVHHQLDDERITYGVCSITYGH